MDEPVIDSEIEAEFTLEAPVRCPHCSEFIEALQVVRILRTKVNFVSSLPRRGQVMICPECRALVTGMVGGLI